MIIWLTGRPCSGKTTLAHSVSDRFFRLGLRTQILDGDEIRSALWPELGYTVLERAHNVLRFAFLATMVAKLGGIPIVSIVSPNRLVRNEIKQQFGQRNEPFFEIYVNAPSIICKSRDVKGMYAKAKLGGITNFTGVDADYEAPFNPDVECLTDIETIQESTNKIMEVVFPTRLTFTSPKE